MFYLYILQSEKTDRYYTGITKNITQRLSYHNKGSNYSTKSGKPWKVIHLEEFPNKKEAWLRERQVKKFKSGEAFKKLINK